MLLEDGATGELSGSPPTVGLAAPDHSRRPHVTEPLMLAFDASVRYRIAIGPEDTDEAGLERHATA